MGQEIVYCSRCQTRIVGNDFESGGAYRIGPQSACSKCAMEMLPTLPLDAQEQILAQKRKSVASKEKRSTSPKLQAMRASGSSTQVRTASAPSAAPTAAWIGIGLTVAIFVGVLAMSGGSSPAPAPAHAPAPAPVPAPRVVEAGPSPRETAAQGALVSARSFARDNPSKFDEQASLFEKIKADFDRTSAADEARRELEAVARRRKAAADAEAAALLGRARELAVGREYQKAITLLEGGRKHADWISPIDGAIKEFTEAMASQFPALLDKAVEARKQNATAELQAARDQVARWGSTRYAEELEKALGEVFPPILAKANGNYMLRIAEAAVSGRKLKKTGEGDWSLTQNWTDLKDEVEWNLVSRRAGSYTIHMNYTSPREYKGSPYGGEVSISVGDQTSRFALESTKGWGDYTTFSCGTIRLPEGPCKVTVRATKIVTNLMSLRFVQLVPVK